MILKSNPSTERVLTQKNSVSFLVFLYTCECVTHEYLHSIILYNVVIFTISNIKYNANNIIDVDTARYSVV